MSAQLVMNTVEEACGFFAELELIQSQIYYQLLARDVSSLEKSIKEQSRVLGNIRMNTDLRVKLMTELGYSTDSQGMRQLMSGMTDEEQSNGWESWTRLEAAIRHCQELNKLNGRIQARLGTVTQRLIRMIDDHYYSLSTYSSEGIPVPLKGRHLIGNA